MLTVLNQARYEDVPSEMKRWNKAGGEVLQGLVRRREAEALLFEGKDWFHV
jgi:lysozyme